MVDEAKAKDDVLQAAQLSIHDVFLIHCFPANRSAKRRSGLAMRYMPTTSYFDRSILSPARGLTSSGGRSGWCGEWIELARTVLELGTQTFSRGLAQTPESPH